MSKRWLKTTMPMSRCSGAGGAKLFGNTALDIKRGKSMIGFKDGRVVIAPAGG